MSQLIYKCKKCGAKFSDQLVYCKHFYSCTGF